MRTHDTGVVSSNPTFVTIKAPLVRKATGTASYGPLPWVIFRALSLVSATLCNDAIAVQAENPLLADIAYNFSK